VVAGSNPVAPTILLSKGYILVKQKRRIFNEISRKYFTFMLIPNDSNKNVIKFNLPSWILKTSIALAVITVFVFLGSVYYSSQVSTKLISYYNVVSENKAQKKQIASFMQETSDLKESIQELRERDQEIRGLLGLVNPYKRTTKTASVVKKKHLDKVFRGKTPQIFPEKIQTEIDNVSIKLNQSKNSYVKLLAAIDDLKYKYEYIPSIWPIYGRIKSDYGWRRHPLLGKSEFHRGVDIPSFLGANVKATAKGKIVFSGWASGYGKTIVIRHRFGFSTIYAHNSRLLIKAGEWVKKGQVISEIGSTGLSTGPHVHYEIRRWKKPVNPKKYLKLDLFTAKREILR
jgi:murein DD-endopeptidase MepM/ murein hydrolase activator NlpD